MIRYGMIYLLHFKIHIVRYGKYSLFLKNTKNCLRLHLHSYLQHNKSFIEIWYGIHTIRCATGWCIYCMNWIIRLHFFNLGCLGFLLWVWWLCSLCYGLFTLYFWIDYYFWFPSLVQRSLIAKLCSHGKIFWSSRLFW